MDNEFEELYDKFISENSHVTFNNSNWQLKPRSLYRLKIKQVNKSNTMAVKIIFFGISTVFAVIIMNLLIEINENPFDYVNASLELNEKIYGQDKAINQLINYYSQNDKNFNCVTLVGGSGVGKSYTKQIIKKYFTPSHNIFEYSPPSIINDVELIYNKLSSLHCNLIIIEYLKLNHLSDLVNFIKFINNQKQRPCAMILAILNPENVNNNLVKTIDMYDSVKKINLAFSFVNIPCEIISFNSLTSDIIDICIRNEAKKINTELTDSQFFEIKNHLLSVNSGCKGAYAKVQLYAKNNQ